MKQTCPTCGKIFNPAKPEIRFCSVACANKSRIVPGKRSIFTCKWCGKEFETWTYRNPTMCSRQCASEYGARQPKPNKRKPEIRVVRTCETCGKEFIANVHQIRLRNGGRFCSRACKGASKSMQMRGEDNLNYKGGTLEENPSYRGANWGQQKRKVLKRDNHQCQICLTHVSDRYSIGVHHIIPYRQFNGDFEAANQVENLITLCMKHHKRIEMGKIPCPKPKS